MHRTPSTAPLRCRTAARLAVALVLGAGAAAAWAQAAAAPDALTLRQALDAAWARQPEQAALSARREAAQAQQQAAQAWTPEPVAVELLTQTDRLKHNLGSREYEAGLAVPLWLPGERGRSQALAQAEGRAVESRATAAQLRVAAGVREAWWAWQRARAEADAAQAQLDNAERIAADVVRRVKAGDLARADQHQADGAVAAAAAAVAAAQAGVTAARLQLRAWTALPALDQAHAAVDPRAEPAPEPAELAADLDRHAELRALHDRARVAGDAAALAATQSRAHPELTLATTRDRGATGEAWQQRVTVGVRIPFGAGPRHASRTAAARADAIELQAQWQLERARLAGERDAAQARTDAARLQLAAAERRALLARESRGFFDKSFRLGQTDLPTRLRIEAEAADAERQAVRAGIELAAALSAWRQALGLLPP
jgi:outer membrane protein, heavy metal efflux system